LTGRDSVWNKVFFKKDDKTVAVASIHVYDNFQSFVDGLDRVILPRQNSDGSIDSHAVPPCKENPPMPHQKTRRAILAVLSGLVLLTAPTSVRADNIFINIQVDNGGVLSLSGNNTQFFSGNVGTGTNAAGNLLSVLFGYGNRTQGNTQSLAEEGALGIVNLDNTAHVLHIGVSATGFTSPVSPPPLNVLDTVSGSVANGNVSGLFQGFADANNTVFGKGFTDPNLNLTIPTTGSGQSFAVDGFAAGFSTTPNAYSLTLFADITLSAGGSITLTGGNVQAAMPAPPALVLVLTGLPCAGLIFLRRRRLVRAA
jgi:hypothetical protein